MADRRRRSDGPVPISESIARVAGRLTRADLLGLGAIVEGWEGVVGAQIAGHATPIRLLDGVLTVAVDQPAWATQLRLHAGELREPLAALGRCPIDQLEVVVRAR
jgi:predicted nucleic acid-binding Zn ribbon protein